MLVAILHNRVDVSVMFPIGSWPWNVVGNRFTISMVVVVCVCVMVAADAIAVVVEAVPGLVLVLV